MTKAELIQAENPRFTQLSWPNLKANFCKGKASSNLGKVTHKYCSIWENPEDEFPKHLFRKCAPYHPGLAEIPAPDGSQEVVGHTHESPLLIGTHPAPSYCLEG